jgi:hypothetical protein
LKKIARRETHQSRSKGGKNWQAENVKRRKPKSKKKRA